MIIKVCDRCKKIINKTENYDTNCTATVLGITSTENEGVYHISISKYACGLGTIDLLKSNGLCEQCKDEIMEFYNKGVKELKYDD